MNMMKKNKKMKKMMTMIMMMKMMKKKKREKRKKVIMLENVDPLMRKLLKIQHNYQHYLVDH
jgi:hypothetical protein